MEPYYQALGEGRYLPTIHVQGAWYDHEQHMAPVAGILAHELERFQPRPELRMARISYDILGVIPLAEFEVVTTMLRPGRRIELVQAELIAEGTVAVRATAWRLQTSDTSELARLGDSRMQGPEQSEPVDLSMWPGGYIASIEIRRATGHAPGTGRVWIRPRHPLVDQAFSPAAALIGLVDTSNGIAPIARMDEIGFPNVDLQLHLHREPAGPWLGLQNTVTFGTDGVGLTSTVLHDETGPFGRAEQILTLRRLSEG